MQVRQYLTLRIPSSLVRGSTVLLLVISGFFVSSLVVARGLYTRRSSEERSSLVIYGFLSNKMTLSCQIILLAVLLVNTVHHSVAPPVTAKAEVENDILDNIGVEYNRYLKEVVQALESDNEFRAKLEKAEDVDLRSGKIAQELQYVRHDVRSKLDELKRAELDRLRHYIRRQTELKQGLDPNHIKMINDQTGHIDGANPHSFEIADLEKLIAKTTQHLAEADRRRREEFKQYELQKEFEKMQELKTLSFTDRERLEQKLREQRLNMRHRQPQLHHPGSKKQLEEVWQYQDHMNVRDFDPKTFFFLHDVDGNGFLDQEEVKALFLRELQKLYSLGISGDDLRERTEEMERMREHVMLEADTNHDGVISLEEWLELTRRPDFTSDPGWEILEPKKEFTQEEYRQFEEQRQKEIEALIAQGKLPRKTPVHVQREAMYAKRYEEAKESYRKRYIESLRVEGMEPPELPEDFFEVKLPPIKQEQKNPQQRNPNGQSPDHLQFQQQAGAAEQIHMQQQQQQFQQQVHPQGQLHPQEQAHFQAQQQAHVPPQQQAQQPNPHLQQRQQPDLHPQQAQQPNLHPQQAQQPNLHPQQAQQPNLHPQQAQQPNLHPQQAQQPNLHPQQAQQPNLHPQQAQHSDLHPQSSGQRHQASAQQNAIPLHEDNNIRH